MAGQGRVSSPQTLDDASFAINPCAVRSARPGPTVEVPRALTHPRMWLMCGMEWPEDESLGPLREAAFAVAPTIVPAELVPEDVGVVYRLAWQHSVGHSARLVFFSDLTRDLAREGLKWWDVGVESWVETQETMRAMTVPGLIMTISYRAHAYLCDASWNGITWHYTDGTTEHDPTEKDRVRAAFEKQLDQDWPPYIEELYAKGRAVEYSGQPFIR